KREHKNIASGVAHVNATFNNTMITITDAQGNTIAWSSAGTMGFKGSRKSTPYAAQVAAEDAAKKAQEHGMRTLEVEVAGPGAARRRAAQRHGCQRDDPEELAGTDPTEQAPVGGRRRSQARSHRGCRAARARFRRDAGQCAATHLAVVAARSGGAVGSYRRGVTRVLLDPRRAR